MSEEKRQIVYEEKVMPVMTEGTYKLVFGQQVRVFRPDEKEEAEDFNQKEQIFQVISENRFQIPSGAVHSTYPAQDAEGDFTAHIAQITFMTASLPWERPLVEGCPWLCLLLFDEEDQVQVQEGALAELFGSQNRPGLYVPNLADTLGASSQMKASEITCRALDVTRAQLTAWLPQKKGLKLSAHIRQVSVEDKASHLYRTEGRFSNLICNRIPRKGNPGEQIRTQVHVVSLEGYEWFYQGSEKEKQKQEKMRLLSLYKWEFTATAVSEKGFAELSRGLDVARLCRRPEAGENNGGQDSELMQKIKKMLRAGYFPMKMETREEARTMCWYKGPLLPCLPRYKVKEGGTPHPAEEYQSCLNDSDANLGYLEDTAMLDVSYGAAWQLGLLLGMKNQIFMEALYAIRQKNYEEAAYKKSWACANQVLDEAGRREREQKTLRLRMVKEERQETIFEKLLGLGADFIEEEKKREKP